MPTIAEDDVAIGPAHSPVSGGLAWKLTRLRSMSPAEVAWRLEERWSLTRLAARAGRPAPRLARPNAGFLSAFRASSALLRPPGARFELTRRFAIWAPNEVPRLAAEAAAVRQGSIELFARRFEFGPDLARWPWNRSPDGGPEVPLAFGPTLDYRAPDRVGNARLAWEFARAQWSAAPAMAAYAGVDEAENVRFVVEAYEAFHRACPLYRGLQWSSALELALRSLSWGWALALVAVVPAADEIAEERWERIFASWAEAIRFVDAHDSRHSSANNHRLGEAAGLAWAGFALSFLPEAAGWKKRGLERLEASFLEQTTEHGITREHALAYQQFVLDFVVSVENVSVRSGRVLPPAVARRIARVAQSLDAFSPGGAAPWAVGDGDEGRALHLGEPHAERVTASLACANALVGQGKESVSHARAAWLGLDDTGGAGRAAGAPIADAKTRSLLPEGAGYAVERFTMAGREARLLFDAAPLGLAPLYAHGHADALMVLLDVDGPRLVDPGTGAYHSDPELRNRLRATAAHNTVELDGQSQSRPGGLFQWFDPARIVGASSSWTRQPDGALVAAHEGYARLGAPIVHERTVRVLEQGTVAVVDALTVVGGADGRVRRAVLRWHVGDGVSEPDTGLAGSVFVRWPDGFEMKLVARADSGAVLGVGAPAVWAPRFLEPVPCGVLERVVESRLPVRMCTVIAGGRGVDGDRIVRETLSRT